MWLTWFSMVLLAIALALSIRSAIIRKKNPDGPGKLKITVKETE